MKYSLACALALFTTHSTAQETAAGIAQQHTSDILCSQQSYRQCLQIDRATCNAQVSAHAKDCLDIFSSSAGQGGLSQLDQLEKYALCVAVSQTMIQNKVPIGELRQCNAEQNSNLGTVLNSFLEEHAISLQ
jgi:hypothetical protein